MHLWPRKPTRRNLDNLGAKHGLSAKDVALMVEEVGVAVGDWGKFAKEAGVTTLTTNLVADAHARVRATF